MSATFKMNGFSIKIHLFGHQSEFYTIIHHDHNFSDTNIFLLKYMQSQYKHLETMIFNCHMHI